MDPEVMPYPPHPVPTGRVLVGEVEMAMGPKGELTPVSTIKPQHLLEDELVRQEMGHALALSAQLSRFREHVDENLVAFEALLFEQYGALVGGPKGNKTLQTLDGRFKLTVQIADSVVFGPELQVAKALVDECLNDWASTARDELRAIITRAFNTDKEGQINRAALYGLLRLEIADERWQRGMQAIRDAMRVVGSKAYVRFYQRDSADRPWEPVTIDLAKA